MKYFANISNAISNFIFNKLSKIIKIIVIKSYKYFNNVYNFVR